MVALETMKAQVTQDIAACTLNLKPPRAIHFGFQLGEWQTENIPIISWVPKI